MALVLDAELKTYEKNRDYLLGTAEGKFVLIHDSQVRTISRSCERLCVCPNRSPRTRNLLENWRPSR